MFKKIIDFLKKIGLLHTHSESYKGKDYKNLDYSSNQDKKEEKKDKSE